MDDERILRSIEALVKIEMTARNQAAAYRGMTDTDRLQVIADLARETRIAIVGADALELRPTPPDANTKPGGKRSTVDG